MPLRVNFIVPLLFTFALTAFAQTTYSNVILTEPPPAGGSFEGEFMNQSGTTVVNASIPGCEDDYVRPWVYDKTGALIAQYAPLEPDPTANLENPCPLLPSAWAYAINNNGDFVGRTLALDAQGNETSDAFIVTNGAMTDLNTLVTGGDTASHLTTATAINNVGQIAGLIGFSNNQGFLFSSGTVTDLGSFIPEAINDSGAMVGYDANTQHVEVYAAGSVTDLGVSAPNFNGGYVLSINSNGHVAGATPSSDGVAAFFWDGNTVTTITDLVWGQTSTLNDYDQLSYVISDTTGANTTYTWSPSTGAQDITSALNGGGWYIPVAMNNAGQFIAQNPNANSGQGIFLFTPSSVTTTATSSSTQVQSGGLTLDFQNGTTAGTTTVSSVDPSTITTIPSGFTAAGAGYEIQSTSATFPATVSFVIPGPMSQADFDSVQIEHYVNGVIDNSITYVSRDYATMTITIQTNSFSPFLPVRKIPPTFGAISDITQEALAAAGNQVNYTVTATDAAGAPAGVTCTPPSGATFPIATTRVGCEAVDSQGLTAITSFKVIVQDTTPPVLTLPSSPIVVPISNQYGATVTFEVSATDNIDGPLSPPFLMCDHSSGDTFPPGATTVNCTAADRHNNQTNGSFQVIVGGPADVALAQLYVKSDGTPKTGSTIQYAIGAANLGPNAAWGTTMTDQLPNGVTFVSASSGLCSASGQTVACALGQMPVNSTFTVVITGQVTATRGTTLVNTATVSAANPDPNTSNNSSSIAVTVH